MCFTHELNSDVFGLSVGRPVLPARPELRGDGSPEGNTRRPPPGRGGQPPPHTRDEESSQRRADGHPPLQVRVLNMGECGVYGKVEGSGGWRVKGSGSERGESVEVNGCEI